MANYLDSRRIMGTTSERSSIPVPATQGGWVELGRTTLGSAGDDIDVTSIPDKRYYMILHSRIATGGNVNSAVTFNADTGSNYAIRENADGGTDTTNTSRSNILTGSVDDVNGFFLAYLSNLSSNEKLWMNWLVRNTTAGSGTAPNRAEQVGKWANTSSVFDEINVDNSQAGSFASGSEVVVLGWDPDDTHTNNFWEELASVNASGSSTTLSSGTIPAKKYLWMQVHTEGSTNDVDFRFNNDSGSNYAYRLSVNGGAEQTVTSAAQFRNLHNTGSSSSPNAFSNTFIINNTSEEKLLITHSAASTAAGATTAPRREEAVGKWANTSNQITKIDVISASGNFGTNSWIKVWGAD